MNQSLNYTNQNAIFIINLDPPYHILEINKSFKALTGYSSKDVSNSNNTLESIVYPEDFDNLIESINYQLSISNLTNNRHKVVKKNGDVLSVLCNGQIYPLPDGQNVLQCVYTDITNLESAALETKRAKSDLASFAKSVPSGFSKHLCDSNLSVIWANDYFYELSGYTPTEWSELLNNNAYSMIYHEDLPIVVTGIADLIETGNQQCTFRIKCKDGSLKWVNAIGSKSDDVENNYPVINIVLSDITALKISEMKADLEERKYQIISDISEEIPYEYEIESDVITYAPKYSYIFGRKSIIKHPKYRLVKMGAISPDTVEAFQSIFDAARRGDAMHFAEYKLLTKDGTYEWYYSTFSAIKDKAGTTTRIVGLLRNIHKQKQEQLRLLNKSERDAMTGLYNKTTTESKIQEQLKTISGNSNSVAFLLDIDDFKTINDTYGHLVGDEVIIDIANILKANASDGDIAGRIGGDEFILYLDNVLDINYACEKADKITKTISEKYSTGNSPFKVTISLGIAYTSKPIPYTTFIKNADTAVYNAKLTGKNCYSLFNKNTERGQYHNNRGNNINTEIISDILDILYSSFNTSEDIDLAISYIGNNLKIDRICVWEYDFDRSYLNRTHHWLKDENCTYDILSDHPASRLLEEIHAMSSSGIFHSTSPSSLPIYSNYKNILSNIDEFIIITIYNGKLPIGYIGFLDYTNTYSWNSSEINLFTLIGKILSERVRKKMTYCELDNLYDNTVNLLNSFPNSVVIVDRDTYEILYYNEEFAEKHPKASIGKKCYYGIYSHTQSCKNCPILQLTDSDCHSITTIDDSNHTTKLDITASSINWKNHPNACILYESEHKASETEQLSATLDEHNLLIRKFAKEAFKDSLTGYSNFDGFNYKVQDILTNNKDSTYVLYYINVKNFKLINEAFGHKIGDKTLKQIADIFNKYTREDEAFARVISDTFVLFKRHKTRDEQIATFTAITDEIKRNCALIQDKYTIDFSVGLIVIDDDNRELSVNTLIDRVIIATRNTPDKPGTNFTFYEDDLRQEYIYQANLENNMYTALAKGEFLPYLQPKFDINTNKIIGSEALVRWMSPTNGFMVPDSFIPIFEKNGFIAEIDLYMLEEVCKTLKDYIMNNYPIYPCSVNLSRVTLNHPDLVNRIKLIIDEYRIPSEYIEFEITENIFVSDHKTITKTLNELKDMGFSISMDDFGSGYSSLILLKDLPIDVLKLDRHFLDSDGNNPNTYHIMKSIVDMSKSLNIKVVCEGVETTTQAEFLKNIGCDVGQGYLFAKPMPVKDFNELFKKKHKKF